MTVAIRMENLTKTFGRGKRRVEAVKDVTLEVETGQVYGFLGPNGAGKTTAIRVMLDLMRPTYGKAYLFEQDVRQHPEILRKVGMLVEGPSFYPYLSGSRNLEVLARTYGQYDKGRLDALLEQVGLADRARQKYRKYSLGMKQRLGLAAALLHDPELVILDEPTNGLDPAGIREMRTLIRDLCEVHGKTVFLSSHLLNEVEQVCDRVAIINKGVIIRDGLVRDLLQEHGTIMLRATSSESVMVALAEHWTVTAAPIPANGRPETLGQAFIIDAPEEDVPHIVRKLVAHDVEVFEVACRKQSLEEVFLNMTNGAGAGDSVGRAALNTIGESKA